MSEIASRLESIRQRLATLEAELIDARQGEFAERLRVPAAELQALIGDLRVVPSPARRKARRKLPDVEKCPRCTIRSLRMIPDEVRQADGTEEVLWRCSSCGHEVWLPDS